MISLARTVVAPPAAQITAGALIAERKAPDLLAAGGDGEDPDAHETERPEARGGHQLALSSVSTGQP